MVTDGSRITEAWLDNLTGSLDILAISIDSVDAETQRKIGRTVKGESPMTEADYLSIGESAKARGMRLKVNTVVNRHNVAEDFRPFIKATAPERWKIFQVLPVAGQNNLRFKEYAIGRDEFDLYVGWNRSVERYGIRVVPENNEAMTGSYLMIDPQGCFFDNTRGKHTYTSPILSVGVQTALAEIRVYPDRFIDRGGLYE
jgi:radical S-adenosyl methionine domain-containing protein 2